MRSEEEGQIRTSHAIEVVTISIQSRQKESKKRVSGSARSSFEIGQTFLLVWVYSAVWEKILRVCLSPFR